METIDVDLLPHLASKVTLVLTSHESSFLEAKLDIKACYKKVVTTTSSTTVTTTPQPSTTPRKCSSFLPFMS